MKKSGTVKVSSTRATRKAAAKPAFPGNEAHLQILKESLRRRSPHFWNQWREQHPNVVPDLRGLIHVGKYIRGLNLTRARLDGAIMERTDLAGVHLERASLKEASFRYADLSNVHAEKANLSGADFRGATLHQGDFRETKCLNDTRFTLANLREANFTGAKMVDANLSRANLTRACFDKADMTSASFSDAVLDETSLLGTRLNGAHLNGTFIRRVKTNDKTKQRGLYIDVHVVWERQPGKMIDFVETNDIHVAQFHNLVDEQGSVGKMLSCTTRQVVLILGRFLPRRKRVLDHLADALRSRGKIAVIFDFPSPEDREISDTVRFIAAMSQFIVVDLTKASSVPLELQATVPDLMVPVLPIIQSGEPVFAMFSDLQRRYSWIQPTVSYKDAKQLVKYVDEAIIDRANEAADQIRERRAAAIRAPINVARVGQKKTK